MVSKDDAGKPAEAITAANELVSNEKVALLCGGFFSNIGLALADFAKQKKVLYLAGEPLTDALVWSAGNRYTFRLRPSNYMQAAMLADEAAKLPAKTWATIAPNYEYGQSAVAVFKKLLSAKRPDITMGRRAVADPRASSTPVRWCKPLRPPSRMRSSTSSSAATSSSWSGKAIPARLFKDRAVVSFLTGEPEYLDALKDEAPEGWIVNGYPWYALHTPEHDAFLAAYRAKYNDYPRLGSVVGYTLIHAAADALRKAKSTDVDALIGATEGLSIKSPIGAATFRAHRSPVDARRLRGPHRGAEQQGYHDRFHLSGRSQLPPGRGGGEGPAAAGLNRRLTGPERPRGRRVSLILAQFLTGLASASSLFLVACGLSIIFGVTRIVNFAHGAFYMLGAYMAFTIADRIAGPLGLLGRGARAAPSRPR